MCGIFGLLNADNYSESFSNEMIEESFYKGQMRGPEHSSILFLSNNQIIQGFHRLAINGLNTTSNQPLNFENCSLICNGEIYNYKQLYQLMDITPNTQSDCEVIIHLYIRYGIEITLRMLDGVFAFILIHDDNIYVARDPYGVRPLYLHMTNKYESSGNSIPLYGFASDAKQLTFLTNVTGQSLQYFPPGNYCHLHKSICYDLDTDNSYTIWKDKSGSNLQFHRYHIPSPTHTLVSSDIDNTDYNRYLKNISVKLEDAVRKRYLTTERPIACLLSGGLDSSLICALVCKIATENGKNPSTIETYSIGMKGSEDLRYAKIVANFLNTTHTEILVTESDMISYINHVISNFATYDVTTIRAGLGNYMIGEYISKHSKAKVVFNGDGSDEVCGGYLYMSSCPNSLEYDIETRRLLQDIHMFDVLRSDKSISSHGLEPRTPFLDKAFVDTYLSIPIEYRDHNICGKMEKYLLRSAFETDGLLPDEILWRKKEAFSDGVSNKGRSLYQIIQDRIDSVYKKGETLTKREKEKSHYKDLFSWMYPNQDGLTPYYWMPKFIISDDPSARTLTTYK